MAFFRAFLMCAFCAVVVFPAWADEDPRMQQAKQQYKTITTELSKFETDPDSHPQVVPAKEGVAQLVSNLDAEAEYLQQEKQKEEAAYKSTMAEIGDLRTQAEAQSKQLDDMLAEVEESIRSSDETLARHTVAATGGCTLEFTDGKLEHVDNATWYTNGKTFIKLTNSDYVGKNDLKDAKDLRYVNGKEINIDINDGLYSVHFFCDSDYGRFDYYCNPGYRGDTCDETSGNNTGVKSSEPEIQETVEHNNEKISEQLTGGATLEFAGGKILTHVASAYWFFIDGTSYITDINNKKYSYTDIALKDLRRINDEDFNCDNDIDGNKDTVFQIYFKSDKFDDGHYFAYECQKGYSGKKIGQDGSTDLYDKCVKQEEKKKNETTKNTNNDARDLADAVENVDAVLGGLKVRKFRDADGNINTARLISDSVAGVVLGTAGGIITSVIVKKNQLKKGFEDIVCTVGGQEVGNYGDEITVGVK